MYVVLVIRVVQVNQNLFSILAAKSHGTPTHDWESGEKWSTETNQSMLRPRLFVLNDVEANHCARRWSLLWLGWCRLYVRGFVWIAFDCACSLTCCWSWLVFQLTTHTILYRSGQSDWVANNFKAAINRDSGENITFVINKTEILILQCAFLDFLGEFQAEYTSSSYMSKPRKAIPVNSSISNLIAVLVRMNLL